MAIKGFLIASILISCLVATSYGITFSTLPRTLDVTSTAKHGQVLKAGEDEITVTWTLNASSPAGTDSDYKTVKASLCYAPISQKDRGWRKTVDLLKKDKTCQHLIVKQAYGGASSNNTYAYLVKRDVPQATYFIRVYAFNSTGHEAGYGQTTDTAKKTNLFDVQAITGRHVSLDIASGCFSAFSIVSLFGFFFMEKRKAKAAK